MVPIALCEFGHLIYRGQKECPRCRLEQMIVEILNRPIEEIMNQTFEEVKYYCVQCTARKYEGWSFCPFCGNSKHCHTSLHGIRVESLGVIRPTKQTVNEVPKPQATEQCAQGDSPAPLSSEDVQFEAALRVIRETFDKVKRVRKSRDKAEAGLKGANDNIRKQASRIHEQELEIQQLWEKIGRIPKPEPVAVQLICGQTAISQVLEPLPILSMTQGGLGCQVTVRLPR